MKKILNKVVCYLCVGVGQIIQRGTRVESELCIWETILNVTFPKNGYFTLTYLQLTGRVYRNDIKQFGVWGLVGVGVQINREVQVNRGHNYCIRVHDCCFKFLRKNS